MRDDVADAASAIALRAVRDSLPVDLPAFESHLARRDEPLMSPNWRTESTRSRRDKVRRGSRLHVENLETRVLLSADGPQPSFAASVRIESVPRATEPAGSSAPSGLSPTQFRQAYGFSAIQFGN